MSTKSNTTNFFFHTGPVANKKQVRVTIAGVYDETSKSMKFGLSRCSKNDQFTKKYGRSASLGRANSAKTFIGQVSVPPTVDNIGTWFTDEAINIIKSTNFKVVISKKEK